MRLPKLSLTTTAAARRMFPLRVSGHHTDPRPRKRYGVPTCRSATRSVLQPRRWFFQGCLTSYANSFPLPHEKTLRKARRGERIRTLNGKIIGHEWEGLLMQRSIHDLRFEWTQQRCPAYCERRPSRLPSSLRVVRHPENKAVRTGRIIFASARALTRVHNGQEK